MITETSTIPAEAAASRGWARHIRLDRPTWWLWALLAALLIAGLLGYAAARYAAMAVAGLQAAAWLGRNRSLAHFPTQVRVAYAIWMAASLHPLLLPMLWIQAAGTTALILLGYCPLARLLLFLPFNRRVPLTLRRAARIVLHPPTNGSVLDELAL
jgi:hypothetical protein